MTTSKSTAQTTPVAKEPEQNSCATIAPTRLPARRFVLALTAAVISDALSLFLGTLCAAQPELQAGLSLLTLAVIGGAAGFKLWLAPAAISEALPMLSAFPLWTLCVLASALKPSPANSTPN